MAPSCRLFLLAVLCCGVQAPRHLPLPIRSTSSAQSTGTGATSPVDLSACVSAAVVAAAAAAAVVSSCASNYEVRRAAAIGKLLKRNRNGSPFPNVPFVRLNVLPQQTPKSVPAPTHSAEAVTEDNDGIDMSDESAHECYSDEDEVIADDAEEVHEEEGVCEGCESDDGVQHKRRAKKLWGPDEFPEGVVGASNWDKENIEAAQEWRCPCVDRNCLSRIKFAEVYDHRKDFQVTCKARGGKRDAFRAILEAHYSKETDSFSRSFVVGSHNDVCAPAMGLACGISVQTYYQAHVDVRKGRANRHGRRTQRDKLEREERTHMEAYIRELRSSMEGDKGGGASGRWHTGKRSVTIRYNDYCAFRRAKGLPVLGSLSLFKVLWRGHAEIAEHRAKQHAVCDECGKFAARKGRLNERTDSAAVALRRRIEEAEAIHDKEQKTEREYFNNAWYRGETYPRQVTCVNIDAPTQHQFDIPFQRRKVRDTVKSLDGARKWQSKLTGAMVAGMGMFIYVARSALGSGPNMVLTVLTLVLQHLAASPQPLGTRLHVQLDNTAGENKNETMIGFLAWLVHMNVFVEASFFCMMKGHTYTLLDQSFSTLITNLKEYAVYTISGLLFRVAYLVRGYNVRETRELHCLWDFKSWLAPHMHNLKGYATGQFGDGMHEFLLRKDRDGHVRVLFRKSSQASEWIPEGQGYKVFKFEPPTEPPPFAKMKPDSTWERKVVEGTVRLWLPHMELPRVEDRVAAKEEWTKRLWALKADATPNDLAEEEKLIWISNFAPRRGQVQADDETFDPLHVTNSSERVENPDVNPITGPGRTAAMVHRDVAQYQAAERARAAASKTLAPIFQSDYLLVRFAAGSSCMTLHRVSHGIFMQDATKEDATFTTLEYAHAPHQTVPGLWGTFAPLRNGSYDKSNAKSGTKFVRHSSLTREQVKLYNVQVDWNAHEKLLRIQLSSLKELSKLLPDEFPFPHTIPDTHQADVSRSCTQQQSQQQQRSAVGDKTVSGQQRSDTPGSSGAATSAPAATQRARRNAQPSGSYAGADDSSDDDARSQWEGESKNDEDPPPPIPSGMIALSWDGERSSFDQFMLWTRLDRQPADWHTGRIVRVLPQGRRGAFTHDASLDGERGRRGVTLSSAGYTEGLWLPIGPAAAD